MDIFLTIVAVYAMCQALDHRRSSLTWAISYFIMGAWALVFLFQ